jgi:hypothetical protein
LYFRDCYDDDNDYNVATAMAMATAKVMGTAKAMVATLAATTTTTTTTYNNQLNGGPPAVDCNDDDNSNNAGDSDRNGHSKCDGDGDFRMLLLSSVPNS